MLDRMGLKVSHNPDGRSISRSRRATRTRWAACASTSPTSSWSTSTTRRTNTCSRTTSGRYSHGCMRVQDPQHYAEVLLSLVRPNDGYTEDRIKKMIAARSETDIQFPTYIPVNLTYQTAFVDDAGKLQFRDDVYGRDKALIAILKGERDEGRRSSRSSIMIGHFASRGLGDAGSAVAVRQHGLFGGGLSERRPAPAPATTSSAGCSAVLPPPPQPAPHKVTHPRKETPGDTPIPSSAKLPVSFDLFAPIAYRH